MLRVQTDLGDSLARVGRNTCSKAIAHAALALLLAACGAPEPRHPSRGNPRRRGRPRRKPAATPPAPSIASTRGSPSCGCWCTGRGAMARLGPQSRHRQSRRSSGWVALAGNAAAASFSLDDPGRRASWSTMRSCAARRARDFAEQVADDAKSGTLRNMLSPAAARCGAITRPSRVHSIAVEEDHGALAADVVRQPRGARVATSKCRSAWSGAGPARRAR